MNYQGIARDASGKPLQGKSLAVRISVLSGGSDGRVVYTETHRVATTEQGSFALAIGRGKATVGKFALVEWGSGNHFLRVEMDPTGGTDFRLMGTSELLSVPYAFHAGTASQLSGNAAKITGAAPGVPAQTWNLFGNSNVNSLTDRIGTTNAADFVMITNNLERLTITKEGKVAIRSDLSVGNDLTVNRNVELNILGGTTINNGPLTVAKASPTALTGTLNVAGATDLASSLNAVGATTLRNTLDVTGTTLLRNTLGVTGATTLGSSLGVTGATTLGNSLGVAGATTLGSSLGVAGPSTLSGTLGVTGATALSSNLSVAGTTALNSMVTVNATLTGGSSAPSAYPLRVMGSDQGVLIKVNGPSNESKSFLSFVDGDNKLVGSIKGQTKEELKNSFNYGWQVAMNAANVAFIIAEGIATGVQLDLGEVTVMAVDGIVATAELAKHIIDMENKVGVTYESGSADYAEWLERADGGEKLTFGDVVGVRGGRISKNTNGADHLMVVSMSPIILGNTPAKGRAAAFEKVAFMGQVPVKVQGGAKVGDYIVASGQHNGLARAVVPSAMSLEQYRQVVGVAWSSAPATKGFSLVNVAVGINTNDLTGKLMEQQSEIDQLRASLNGVVSYLQVKDPAFAGTALPVPAKVAAKAPPAPVAATLPTLPATLQAKAAPDKAHYTSMLQMFAAEPSLLTASMAKVKSQFESKGVDLNKFPELKRLLTDESYFLATYSKMQ